MPEPAPVSSADMRHLVGLFRGRNPRKVPPGETRTVRLSAREFDELVAWAAWVGARARATADLRPGGVSGAFSIKVPRTGLWLNLAGSTRVSIERGRLSLSELRLRLGRVTVPPLLLDAVISLIAAGLLASPPARPTETDPVNAFPGSREGGAQRLRGRRSKNSSSRRAASGRARRDPPCGRSLGTRHIEVPRDDGLVRLPPSSPDEPLS